jgi:hypothetical protein
MSGIKICPECNVEYFAHVNNCADCGATLVDPEALRQAQAPSASGLNIGHMDDEPVSIREGEKDWIRELAEFLLEHGISCGIAQPQSCGSGSCGTTHHLVVARKDAERALQGIDHYYREMHPEMREAAELAANDCCPACGYKVGPNARECPDCGLMLMFEAE